MPERIKLFQDLVKIRGCWENIFSSNDPFSMPFASNIKEHFILYPTNGYYLTFEQFNAMTKAYAALQETGFLLSIVEYEETVFQRDSNWWCTYPTYEEYVSIVVPLENSLFSINSLWGILVSHEDHAVIGGNNEFASTFKYYYPNWASDTAKLRDAWSNNPNRDWIDEIDED
jgi:hypothetical protein